METRKGPYEVKYIECIKDAIGFKKGEMYRDGGYKNIRTDDSASFCKYEQYPDYFKY